LAGIIYSLRGKDYWAIFTCGLFHGGSALLCIIASKFSALILLSVPCLIILTVAIAKGYFKGNKKVRLLRLSVKQFLKANLRIIIIKLS